MVTKRTEAASTQPRRSNAQGRSRRSNASTTDHRRTTPRLHLEWAVRRQETFTTVTEAGLVCIVSHTSFVHVDGSMTDTAWHAQISNQHGQALMQGAEESREAATASIVAYLAALRVARERDPQH